jgi:hypothetical protein
MGTPLTSANFDFLLLRMAGKKLAYAGLDAITADGTNQDLLASKLESLRFLGVIPASPVAVVDADLARIADADVPQLLTIADLIVNETILGNRAAPDQTADTDNIQLHGKFYDSLDKTTARKRLQCQRQYGYGLASLVPGVVDLGFQETIDLATGRPI